MNPGYHTANYVLSGDRWAPITLLPHALRRGRMRGTRGDHPSSRPRVRPSGSKRTFPKARRHPMTKRSLMAGVTTLLVAIVVGTGVGMAGPPPAYFVDESKLPFDELPGTSTVRYWGVHGGAGYRIEVPVNWNGDLVLYAHGFRGTGLELTITNPRIRQWLVTHGYAWAASSFSTNGYDVKQGVKDTHDLGQLFNGLVGNPKRTYITGHSMGGHITGVAIEQYPSAYVGALPMCGVMGDNELFDYFLRSSPSRLTIRRQ